MNDRIDQLRVRYQELDQMISEPDIIADQKRWRELMKEQAGLRPIVEAADALADIDRQIADNEELIALGGELGDMAHAENDELRERRQRLEADLKILLLPKDPNDDRNVILEIRPGTGGEEAALFAADLTRMYTRYAERMGWKVDVGSMTETELGGIKEIALMLAGDGAYSHLKFESGAHRVQRVPETESGGRIHTSAVTVAVLPEVDDIDVDINPNDLRIDVYRSSGKGGQHVNTTDSAVRITHIPSGFVVACQNERSQIQNKEKCMRVLRSQLYDHLLQQQQKEVAGARKSQVGSGDRSERVRTYNYAQNRVTDHRINMTLYKLDSFLQGDCEEMIEALRLDDQTRRLTAEG